MVGRSLLALDSNGLESVSILLRQPEAFWHTRVYSIVSLLLSFLLHLIELGLDLIHLVALGDEFLNVQKQGFSVLDCIVIKNGRLH